MSTRFTERGLQIDLSITAEMDQSAPRMININVNSHSLGIVLTAAAWEGSTIYRVVIAYDLFADILYTKAAPYIGAYQEEYAFISHDESVFIFFDFTSSWFYWNKISDPAGRIRDKSAVVFFAQNALAENIEGGDIAYSSLCVLIYNYIEREERVLESHESEYYIRIADYYIRSPDFLAHSRWGFSLLVARFYYKYICRNKKAATSEMIGIMESIDLKELDLDASPNVVKMALFLACSGFSRHDPNLTNRLYEVSASVVSAAYTKIPRNIYQCLDFYNMSRNAYELYKSILLFNGPAHAGAGNIEVPKEICFMDITGIGATGRSILAPELASCGFEVKGQVHLIDLLTREIANTTASDAMSTVGHVFVSHHNSILMYNAKTESLVHGYPVPGEWLTDSLYAPRILYRNDLEILGVYALEKYYVFCCRADFSLDLKVESDISDNDILVHVLKHGDFVCLQSNGLYASASSTPGNVNIKSHRVLEWERFSFFEVKENLRCRS